MRDEELKKVYSQRLHREISGRTAISKDRTLNLLTAVQRLQSVVDDKDARLIQIQDLCGELFGHIKNALDLEDRIDTEIQKLAQEIGRVQK
jgi:hypothetical protein